MEIYDEEVLSPFELVRQRNIIKNYEFMIACGKFVNVRDDHVEPTFRFCTISFKAGYASCNLLYIMGHFTDGLQSS